jgi:predicted MFS family arabinose efflux permease
LASWRFYFGILAVVSAIFALAQIIGTPGVARRETRLDR